jgi:hypothetical protein
LIKNLIGNEVNFSLTFLVGLRVSAKLLFLREENKHTRRGGKGFFVIDNIFAESVADLLRPWDVVKIEAVRITVLKIAQRNYDEVVLQWLEVVEEMFPSPSFRDWIKTLFWDLPHDNAHYPILQKSKEWILRKALEDWQPEYVSATSTNAFLFLLAVYMPTEDRMKAAHVAESVVRIYRDFWDSRDWTCGSRKTILEFMRHHIGPQFAPIAIEKWLESPYMHDDIADVLLHAWVRNGGWLLMQRHLRNAKTLEWFEPEKRSDQAHTFLHQLGGDFARLDVDVDRLVAAIPSDLRQHARWYYHALDRISLALRLREDYCSVDEAMRFYDQVRIAVEKWIAEQQKQSKGNFRVFIDFCVGSEATPKFRKGKHICLTQ